jgi:hypothetical protein
MGTGGSRYGAGRHGWRRKCESYQCFDIRRADISKAMKAWTVQQQDRYPASVRVSYTWTSPHGEAEQLDYKVRIERTRTPYGWRAWWLCPRCGSRRAILYGYAHDGMLGCRGCMGLGYHSESLGALDRSWRQIQKIEAKLGKDSDRPKGMRQRRYEIILAQLDAAYERKDAAWCRSVTPWLQRRGFPFGGS